MKQIKVKFRDLVTWWMIVWAIISLILYVRYNGSVFFYVIYCVWSLFFYNGYRITKQCGINIE